MAYPALQVDYNAAITPKEKEPIDAVCLKFRNDTKVLKEKKCNQVTVYRAPKGWWHSTKEDAKEHVTVRYNRYSERRCHIYRNGSGTIRPPKLTAEQKAANDDPDNSDWSVEFSDREDDGEDIELGELGDEQENGAVGGSIMAAKEC